MSDDNKVYGELTVRPPLNWVQIRSYRGEGGLVRAALEMVIEEVHEENDYGTHVTKTCSLIRPENWEEDYGVVGALSILADVAPDNEFIGDITIVNENPQFDEDAREPDAKRYSISGGRLYVASSIVSWTEYKIA